MATKSKERNMKAKRLKAGKKRMEDMYGSTKSQKDLMMNLWSTGNSKIKKLV